MRAEDMSVKIGEKQIVTPAPHDFFSNLDELHMVSRVRDGKVKANGRSQEM